MGGRHYNLLDPDGLRARVDAVLERAATRQAVAIIHAERDLCTCPHPDAAHLPGLGCVEDWDEQSDGCPCDAAFGRDVTSSEGGEG